MTDLNDILRVGDNGIARTSDDDILRAGDNGIARTSDDDILRVEDLSVAIVNGGREIPIVHHASFAVARGQRWGIAGESGAGKSMMMKAVLALLPDGSTKLSGRVLYRLADGSWQNLLEMPYRNRHAFVSKRVAVIFQDSIHALNPNERILKQWGDTVKLHHPATSKDACEQHLLAQMDIFGIRGGMGTLRSYPHQLSGGMRQRIAIAMALESQNGLGSEADTNDAAGADAVADVDAGGIIVADEPTTSLDSVTQRAVVDYIRDICATQGKTLLYVSHNLGILQYLCNSLMVLKDGCIVEQGRSDDLFFRAQHPYTRAIVGETLKIMGERA